MLLSLLLLVNYHLAQAIAIKAPRQRVTQTVGRQRSSLNEGWRFLRTTTHSDQVIYDQRPDIPAQSGIKVLKSWILPSAKPFIKDPAKRHQRPTGNAGGDVPFAQIGFNDSAWAAVRLPHDWAIQGPFYADANPVVGGGMGRLPVQGVGWYRRKLSMAPGDKDKSIYLDIDGAMSYAIVWLNGELVGGWPYGYNSFRLDLTPFLKPGDDNQLSIRLDNPTDSARWYPGGGLYRNVWLTKTNPTHVAQWGTFISTKNVTALSAVVDLVIQVDNGANASRQVEVATEIFVLDLATGDVGDRVIEFERATLHLPPGESLAANVSATIMNPRLWGPVPGQEPNLYMAVTRLYAGNDTPPVDTYKTRFGIRSLTHDANKGLLVNGKSVRIQGVNQHHDLGALGAAFNIRAAERQLELLQDLGCNAIRMSHNPPAPELLDLADQMGFLVMDEIFDCWEREKTTSDFHLIFPDWHEADLRAFIRRDRNHRSIIAWSFGNEVGEQYTADAGAALAKTLHDIAREEDPTRPSTASMNYAKPDMPFPRAVDILSLNYQGEGIRDTPAYSNLNGIRTGPLYADFHKAFPDKMIASSETASTLSTRGTYIFPVVNDISAPVNDSSGGNTKLQQVSAYELYTADFGSSPDKVFAAQDKNTFVAGEFVWTGWDYLGEPAPYYSARSSYCGIIDLAGFKKDRFYLYQSYWRPDHRMAHILPHWTWPDRVGKVTPIHVFSAADEAGLFLDGKSLGRQKKVDYKYRFRWDEVTYQPGELLVITYKNGEEWARDSVRTTNAAKELRLAADRVVIDADGNDLSFIMVEVVDDRGDVVHGATNTVALSLDGPGEIVATDNGDPADLVAFPSTERNTYSGLALVVVRSKAGTPGNITLNATGKGLGAAEIMLQSR